MKNYSKEELVQIIKKCKSKADFCRALDLKPSGSNYYTIRDLIDKYDLPTDSFTNEPWNKGKHYKCYRYKLEDILVENSIITNTTSLKRRLWNEGIKPRHCENPNCQCKNIENPTLEIHHINGNSTDNRLENLQILCVECHSKTENWNGKNSSINKKRHKLPEELFITQEEAEEREKARKKKRHDDYVAFKKSIDPNYVPKSERNLKPQKTIICPVCGKEFIPKEKTTKYCSVECYREANKGKRPPIHQLILDFKTLKSFVKVGEFYGVSDKAVVKWCKFYGIPSHKKELMEYIDNYHKIDYVLPEEYSKIRKYDDSEIISLYESGNNIKQIAEILKCDEHTISKKLKQNNIPIRNGNAKKNKHV